MNQVYKSPEIEKMNEFEICIRSLIEIHNIIYQLIVEIKEIKERTDGKMSNS